ncbi:DUF349 domain-containing protein [Demetria terragena]|uniref:DUF349 domain-containing protein n=1 Tax=Demetria terragena TaxID=63959 RepID=UPI000360FC63|nr:DUF349 domain-containing protein [Demetria terragena]
MSTSNAATFGRVADDGIVYVRTPDGEREVGSYPGQPPEEALAYFARKYDELMASASLLLQRVTQTDLSTQDGYESLKALRQQVSEARVVGDLASLDSTVENIATALKAKSQVEGERRAEAKKEAIAQREKLVAEAEGIAAQPVEKVQWKQSTARMRELLDEWKTLQRGKTRLDKPVENELWQRFASARNGFDKARRSHFAQLDEQHASAKQEKQRLVVEAEKLATSKDWGPTASAFKRLMGEWRQAGRASRSDDDALWKRFKTAQDSFFAAKDEVVAAENVEFEANLKVKEGLLTEAQALLPIKDVAEAKSRLRTIQDKWDAAGKVPRKDIQRIERSMKKVEDSIRDADEARWKKTDPELSARANSMVTQLESAVESLKADLAKAQASGDEKKITAAQEALDARQVWLDQARKAATDAEGGR